MKRLFKLLFVMVFVLAGCGSGSSNASGSDIELEFWVPGAEDEYGFYYDAAAKYSEMTEGVTITPVQQPWGDYWTKLPLEINNGRGPGIFITHTSYSDVLGPITAEMDMTSDELAELGYTNTDLYVGENGNPQFIPALYAPNVIYYNKAMWENAGLTESDYPQTWDELGDIALQLKSEENKVIGFDYSFHVLYDLALQNGQPLVNEDGKANFYPESLDMITNWQEQGITDYMAYGAGSPEESFLQGAAAMVYGQPWMANYFTNTMPDLEFGSFPVPSNTDEAIKVTSQAELTPGINKNLEGEEMQAAQDFIKWMLTDEEVMISIAEGNNGASANEKFMADQTYEPNSAGQAVLDTLESESDMFVIIPATLEDSYKVLVESTISTGGADNDANIAKAQASADNTDLTMTQELENRKLSE